MTNSNRREPRRRRGADGWDALEFGGLVLDIVLFLPRVIAAVFRGIAHLFD